MIDLNKNFLIFLDYSISVLYTICPGNSDPIYVVAYYIKRGKTSWTDRFMSMCLVIASVIITIMKGKTTLMLIKELKIVARMQHFAYSVF